MSASIAERHNKCDQRALQIASAMQTATGAELAILFGSRARGDHRVNSDVDILLITPSKPPQKTMERIEDMATLAQKLVLPEASGVDIGCMTQAEFLASKPLLNSLARSIARQGVPAMPRENMDYGSEYFLDDSEEATTVDRQINWTEVEDRAGDAWACLHSMTYELSQYGQIGIDDKVFAFAALSALECAYKSVLGSHGIEYPAGGNDGHNLRKLADIMRNRFGSPVAGEQLAYLTTFGGGAWYAHEHMALDKPALARAMPAVIEQIMRLKAERPA